MAAKTLLFLMIFAALNVGTLLVPMVGVLGYIAHYNVGPERQWWAVSIGHWGIRYAMSLAIFTAAGMVLNIRRLRLGRSLLHGPEKLILLFLAIVWLSVAIAAPTKGWYRMVDHPSLKLTKVVIFMLMLTHIVTTRKLLNVLFWALVIGSLVLGVQAYMTPASEFTRGRLETVGGVDFRESNVLAAYLAALLPLIAVQFLRSQWPGKLLCLLAGAFATNAIILTRSRGAVVGIVCGVVAAAVMAPRKHRLKIFIGLAIAGLAAYRLADPGFLERVVTIRQSEAQKDASAQSRLAIWSASVRMLKDRPAGVGAGNFFQTIGRYAPEYEGRDAHSTFVRCWAELGVHGLAVFLAVVAGALLALRRAVKQARQLRQADRKDVTYVAYGLAVGFVTFLACGATMTLLYIEAFWLLLAMPVCLVRTAENLVSDASRARKAAPARGVRRRSPRVAVA